MGPLRWPLTYNVWVFTLCVHSYRYSRVPLLVSSFPLLLFLGQLIKPFATARGPAHIFRATKVGLLYQAAMKIIQVSRYQCQLRHCMTLKSLAIPLSPLYSYPVNGHGPFGEGVEQSLLYCHSITEAFLLGPSLFFSQRVLDLKMESGLETRQGILCLFFF